MLSRFKPRGVSFLRLSSSRGLNRDIAAAERRLSLSGICFGLQQKIARRIGHVEIDMESGLAQRADSEWLLGTCHFASHFRCQRNRQSAGGFLILVVYQVFDREILCFWRRQPSRPLVPPQIGAANVKGADTGPAVRREAVHKVRRKNAEYYQSLTDMPCRSPQTRVLA